MSTSLPSPRAQGVAVVLLPPQVGRGGRGGREAGRGAPCRRAAARCTPLPDTRAGRRSWTGRFVGGAAPRPSSLFPELLGIISVCARLSAPGRQGGGAVNACPPACER